MLGEGDDDVEKPVPPLTSSVSFSKGSEIFQGLVNHDDPQTAQQRANEYLQKHNVEEMLYGIVRNMLKAQPENPFLYLAQETAYADAKKGKGAGLSIMEVPTGHLYSLFEATKAITAEIVPKETVNIIIRQTIKLLNCDRASLFVFDKRVDMLILNASNQSKPIRISPGQGIAGHVFTSKEAINIPECYSDDRFDQSFDTATGYRTKSLLCMPILDFEDEAIGVVQAINKVDDGYFTQVDELLMGHLAQHAGIALRNAEVYREAIQASDRSNALIQTMQALAADLGAQSVILTLSMHANELVRADKNTVWLVDHSKEDMWSVSTDSGNELRIPMSAGIAGECRKSNQIINIRDAYQDDRFSQAVDAQTGYRTKSILAVPITCEEQSGVVLGVIQLINRLELDGEVGEFDDADIKIMETFSRFIGPRVMKTTFLNKEKKVSEMEAVTREPLPTKSLNEPQMVSLAEVTAEEEAEQA
mmetsp:Transcript_803/g.1586  ORF Transcript_803/g.1586 Transcript_803/m.1586 type:complete len:475 (+) Transcript_803:36-1460(+)|eukprot:CAMPEP_0204276930 /NCGR_PEP_ID=MMETSP0468-20130131/29007_1 /ASSEMBLY_ACC=CAM_ASM_000383 /TAXON_ID=2969 /ORGANISM="Oxyrrhis marina" /LENGTH=474 /DNA_ID=CAMNT_0051253637 /DNA_START=35 /DNA_END=1459 /DNA_ORIENTATION=+